MPFKTFFIYNLEGQSSGEEYLYSSLNQSGISLQFKMATLEIDDCSKRLLSTSLKKLRLYMQYLLLCMCIQYTLAILLPGHK